MQLDDALVVVAFVFGSAFALICYVVNKKTNSDVQEKNYRKAQSTVCKSFKIINLLTNKRL